MLKLIKSHDLFGHEVQLSFNKKGNAHNTLVGGIFSVLIKFLVLAYTTLLFKKLVNKEGDTYSSITEPQNFEELGVLKMNETDAVIMMDILNLETNS